MSFLFADKTPVYGFASKFFLLQKTPFTRFGRKRGRYLLEMVFLGGFVATELVVFALNGKGVIYAGCS